MLPSWVQHHLPQAADPLRAGDDLEDLDALLDGAHRLLADLLDDPVPDVGPGQAEDRGEEPDDALGVERLGQLDPALGEGTEQPAHQSAPQVAEEVLLELEDAALDAGDQVAQELHRALDDLADDTGHPGQHVLEHRGQLTDRVDHGLDRADGLVDQALVLGLQLLDPLVETLARLDVLAWPACRPAPPAWRRRRSRAGRTGRRSPSTPPTRPSVRSFGRLLTYVGDLGPAGRDPLLGRRQVVADDVGNPGDDLVHLLEVELAPGHVELVDLVGHPLDLVPGPAERPEPAAVPVLLVRRHLRRDIALEHRSCGSLPLAELLLHHRVDAVEDLLDVGLGGVEDPLDLGRDLGPLRLVLGLRLALVRDQLRQAQHPCCSASRPPRRRSPPLPPPCPGR